MSSPPRNNSISDLHASIPTMLSTPPRSTSLDDSTSPPDNDNMSSRSTPANSSGSRLSPADCRTLQKILHDVHSPSTLPKTSYSSEEPKSRLDLTATPTGSVGEEKVICRDEEFDGGDEREGGYQDEDGSMELSDDEDPFGIDGQKDRDTIEDVMNLPGKTALPMPVQDYSTLYPHNQPASGEAEQLQSRRASIERDLTEQCQQQGRALTLMTTDGVFDTDTSIHGVKSHKSAVDDAGGLQTVQGDIGMHSVEAEQVPVGTIGSLKGYSDQSRPRISSRHVRSASVTTPPISTSFIAFTSSTRAVIQTPNGRHIDFAPYVTISDTSLTNTRGYFEPQESKDNSPHKGRRNAPSPVDIAELAREARVEAAEAAEQRELAELDQFRDLDLAPIETVMEGGAAGDLIVCGTPVKTRDEALFLQSAADVADSKLQEWVDLQHPQSVLTPPRRSTLLEQDEENDADVEDSDSTSVPARLGLEVAPRDPTFITVIRMLPASMFWATAAPLAYCIVKAFDILIEKLTGLKV